MDLVSHTVRGEGQGKYIYLSTYAVTGCRLEDLSIAMDNWDGWWLDVKGIFDINLA